MNTSFISQAATPETTANGSAPNVADLSGSAIDIDFVVPQRQRLRFTDDVFGAESDVLLDLLEPGGSARAKVQVWVDDNVAVHCADRIKQLSETLAAAEHVELTDDIRRLPGGEASKLDQCYVDELLAAFNAADLDRRSYVIAIGGGALLDTVGFAAATAHRGIRLIRLPTTTLSQDDSGVGVKNAVNYFDKKNWLGSFAVPWAVINDAGILEGLPNADFYSGFSEAVKVTLLKGAAAFEQLCADAHAIHNREYAPCQRAIRNSVLLHLMHITHGGDPFEVREARPLDFGHWSAHKMESLSGYTMRHGDAVAVGVALDCLYSVRAYGFPQERADAVIECLRTIGLPIYHPILDAPEPLYAGLEEFRQHLGGRLTVTMLREAGEPVDVHEIDKTLMGKAIADLRAYSQPAPVAHEAEAMVK